MSFDFDFERQDRRRKHRRILTKILIWILQIAVVIAIAYFAVQYTMERTNMPGSSMEPTLMDNDTIIVNRLAYFRNGPERFDVIVYKKSGMEHDFYSIKRVIGLPGETIQIIDGSVYIDGFLLDEPMATEPITIAGLAQEPVTLDEDEYFVLGDNRNASEDSRFINSGNVVLEDIIGKAWLRTNKFGFVSKFNLKQDAADDDE